MTAPRHTLYTALIDGIPRRLVMAPGKREARRIAAVLGDVWMDTVTIREPTDAERAIWGARADPESPRLTMTLPTDQDAL